MSQTHRGSDTSGSVTLADAQRVLLRNQAQFAKYPGVAEIGIIQDRAGVIHFVITCRTPEAAESLPTMHAVDGLPVKIEIEEIDNRVAASLNGTHSS